MIFPSTVCHSILSFYFNNKTFLLTSHGAIYCIAPKKIFFAPRPAPLRLPFFNTKTPQQAKIGNQRLTTIF
jgi:hypothetical protein